MHALTQSIPIIRPVTDMRTKFNEVCNQATECQEPVVLTKNGVPSYVFMDSSTYEAEQRKARHYMALREAEIEERYRPASVTQEESDSKIKEIFASWGIDYA